MTIDVKWANEEKTICVLQRSPNWTWEEFDAANVQSNTMIKAVHHTVDLIVDGADRLPPGSPAVHFKKAMISKPENLRYVIIVISNPFGRIIFNVMSKLSLRQSRKLVSASSTEEAYVLVRTPASIG